MQHEHLDVGVVLDGVHELLDGRFAVGEDVGEEARVILMEAVELESLELVLSDELELEQPLDDAVGACGRDAGALGELAEIVFLPRVIYKCLEDLERVLIHEAREHILLVHVNSLTRRPVYKHFAFLEHCFLLEILFLF